MKKRVLSLLLISSLLLGSANVVLASGEDAVPEEAEYTEDAEVEIEWLSPEESLAGAMDDGDGFAEEFAEPEIDLELPDPESAEGDDFEEYAEEEISVEYGVFLLKAEGGEVFFAEKTDLPETEENEEEAVREVRRFPGGEEIGLTVAEAEGYTLQSLKVCSCTDPEKVYELRETEQGYAFIMPEEDVYIAAVFGEAETEPEDSTQAGAEGSEETEDAADAEESAEAENAEETGDSAETEDSAKAEESEEAEEAEEAEAEEAEEIEEDSTLLQAGTWNSGTISGTNKERRYTQVLSSSGRVTVEAIAQMTSIYYYIYDQDNQLVWQRTAYWNASAGQSDITEEVDLTKGTYYFVVRQNGSYTGNYKFRISFSSAGESFSETGSGTNNSFDQASPIRVNSSYKGQIAKNDNRDYYKFDLPVDDTVTLNATARMSRVFYYIYDQNQKIVTSSVPYWDASTKQSDFTKQIDLTKGTYYFVVSRYSSTGSDYTGPYSFKISANIPVTGVKLNKTSQSIVVGKTATLTATVSPSNATNKAVTWESSNTSVATVSSAGKITAKKAGTATITVTTKDGGKKATCKVTVKVLPVTGVKLSKTSMTLEDGKSATLKATVSPSDATNKKVTWKSSNTKLATVTSSGKVTAKTNVNGTVKITATTADGKKVATCTVTVRKPSVSYRTHVQTYGWQGWKKDGAVSGTTGQSKRLEGINIQLSNKPYSGGISYRTHIQTYGWEQNWKSNGSMSGTSGQSKRLEAIQIKLTGEMAKHYDVYYRVHAQTYGWLGWAKNGASAGTSGLSKRLEGIQIRLVKKGGSAPGSTARAYVKGSSSTASSFDKNYFINRLKEAGSHYATWYLTHAYYNWDLISPTDVIYRYVSAFKTTYPYYAVKVNGIHSVADMRRYSHKYYTNSCILQMENIYKSMYLQPYIEQNNKLYVAEPSGLGSGASVEKVDIQVTKESSTSYKLVVKTEVYPYYPTVPQTIHYVKENGEWCFDHAIEFISLHSTAKVTCTVK